MLTDMKLSGEIVVDAPAERVWEVVAHRFDRIGDWATAIPASRINARAVSETDAPVGGRVCTSGLPLFPHVEETIIDYDEQRRTLTYEGRGLPSFVGRARNRWQVTAVDDHRAHVSVEATLETRGLLGRLLRVPLRLQLTRAGNKMLEDLQHYVEHGRPSPRKLRRLRKSER